MCIDPLTAMMMIGTGVKMFGAVKDGEEEGRRMDESDRQKQRLVDVERRNNTFETARERDKARKLTSRQLATFAENGIQIDGSAQDVIEDSAREAGSDIAMMNQNSYARRQNMTFEGSRFRAAGKNARKKGKFRAFAKLIDGGTKLAGSF